MTNWHVTLTQLRAKRASFRVHNKVVRMLQGRPFTDADFGLERYLDLDHDEPIPLADIARNNGLDDALWACRCLDESHARNLILYGVWAARKVEHLFPSPACAIALDVAERFADGLATLDELRKAREAAYVAARAAWAVWHAARAAARPAWAAAVRSAEASEAAARAVQASAGDEAMKAMRKTQLAMFIAMCEGRAPWQQTPAPAPEGVGCV